MVIQPDHKSALIKYSLTKVAGKSIHLTLCKSLSLAENGPDFVENFVHGVITIL